MNTNDRRITRSSVIEIIGGFIDSYRKDFSQNPDGVILPPERTYYREGFPIKEVIDYLGELGYPVYILDAPEGEIDTALTEVTGRGEKPQKPSEGLLRKLGKKTRRIEIPISFFHRTKILRRIKINTWNLEHYFPKIPTSPQTA